MAQKTVPVYVIAGFLEAGKTHMVKELLEDPEFTEGEKTALIVCEEGEEEYPQELLDKTKTQLYMVDSKEAFTYGMMAKIAKNYQPERVILEYNGTWPVAELLQRRYPDEWGIAQIITPVNAETFDVYINNMRQIMVDQLSYADLILFNRCTDQSPVKTWYRNMKLTNRAAMVIFEKPGGDVIEISGEDILPYNVHADVIDIEDDDFGIFYVDAMDNGERYEGKTIHFKGMVCHDPSFPKGFFVPGRLAMTCCANDMQFFGYLCRSKVADRLKDETWVDVTAEVHVENMQVYGGPGPVLYAKRLAPAEKPVNENVYLY